MPTNRIAVHPPGGHSAADTQTTNAWGLRRAACYESRSSVAPQRLAHFVVRGQVLRRCGQVTAERGGFSDGRERTKAKPSSPG